MDIEKKNIDNSITLDQLTEVLDSGAILKAKNLLNSLYPSEIALEQYAKLVELQNGRFKELFHPRK